MTQQVEKKYPIEKKYPTEDQADMSRRVLKEMNDTADRAIDEQTGRTAPGK
jgi:hypothetical protein